MKISILLPYKENFSPEYPGAVSLFVYETTKISRFKKDIIVFGNTNFAKKFPIRYKNISTKKNILSSQTRDYVKKFIELEKTAKESREMIADSRQVRWGGKYKSRKDVERDHGQE